MPNHRLFSSDNANHPHLPMTTDTIFCILVLTIIIGFFATTITYIICQ